MTGHSYESPALRASRICRFEMNGPISKQSRPTPSRFASIRVSELFYLVMILCVGVTFWLHGKAAPPYAICCTILALPLVLTSTTHPYRFYMLLVSISLFLAYLLRPIVLLWKPAFYKYDLVGTISSAEVAQRLWELIPLLSCFLIGTLAFSLLIRPTVRPFVALSDNTKPATGSIVMRSRKWLIIMAWIVLFGNVGLALAYNIGVKNVEVTAPHLQVISRLFPQLLLTAVCVTLLSLYRRQLDPMTLASLIAFLMGAAFYELLIKGSKAGLAFIFFAFFVVQIVRFNDFSMKTRGVVTLGAASIVCLLIAFSLSNVVRYGNTDAGLISRAGSALTKYSGEVNIADSVNAFTGRMCGFDGQLVVQQHRPVKLRKSFQVSNILRNAVARTVPGVNPGTVTTGKAVAVHYQGASKHARFSGGVGIFGTFSLISYGKEWLAALLLGLGIGLVFRVLHFVEDPGIFLILQVVFFYFLIQLIISGGIGNILANSMIVLGQCFVLAVLLKLFGGVIAGRVSQKTQILPPGFKRAA